MQKGDASLSESYLNEYLHDSHAVRFHEESSNLAAWLNKYSWLISSSYMPCKIVPGYENIRHKIPSTKPLIFPKYIKKIMTHQLVAPLPAKHVNRIFLPTHGFGHRLGTNEPDNNRRVLQWECTELRQPPVYVLICDLAVSKAAAF